MTTATLPRADAPPPTTKVVTDLHVSCSLRIRNLDSPGFAMSDCCGMHATSAVVMENGDKMWRCRFHRGVRRIRPLETGPVVDEVEANW